MRLIQSFILFVALLPGLAMALGLGKLQSHSALNEPFSARIDLLSPTVEELDSLNVRLADVEAFRRAGIPRTRVLTELHFSLKRPEAGTDYIHIYSDDPVREPFLNFLIEVSWSKGRLYREYTVLLDPPVYIGARTGKKPVQTTAPVSGPVAPSGGEVQAIEDNKVVYNPEYKPSARTTTAPAPVPARAVDYSGGDYGPVVSGDTLWSIASAMRPDSSVSVQQTMLALLRANPDAFINNNINGLKRGHVLKMPDRTAIQSVSKNDAFAEAKLQNNLWEEARGALATAVTPRPEGAPVAEQPAAPTAETEAAPSPAMGEEPELRLVAPSEEGEAGEQAGTASNEALTQELALANESLEALKLENNELRDKLSETEAIIDDLNRLIVLKESELAELQQQVATAEMQAKAEAEEKAAAEKEKAAAATTKQKMAEKPAEETAAAGSGKKEKMAEKPAEAVPPPAEEGGITSLIPPSLSGVIDII
ncbi:MAG TPA: FimV/HubP family polar landmark protein, partial [Gammaproteobacteria bacterium]|nr:FimV/HubP family polar landmark protein [Gammaproteobacteria bacterium]